ncbi:MAG: hypothetical protein E6R11_06070 [Rhodocyclaceae bacterium]|nr:MAG: hypothetical protein E6R11_06070 [Rhodocyclaceae bacterium]
MKTPVLLALLTAGFIAAGTSDYHTAIAMHEEHGHPMLATELDTLTPAERALLAACARADLAGGADPCAAVQLVRLGGELAGIGPVRDAEGYALADLAALDGEVRP